MSESDINEKQLIADCQQGDSHAQRRLYELYSGKMMGVCLRYCKDKETAKDLLHDGFLKVYTHLDGFEGKGSFEGWMRRIMVNTALEYIRKKSDEGYCLDIEEAFTLTSQDYGVLEKMQAEELVKIIQKLPHTYRTTFNLFVVEGYSHKEIAEAMNITESSSRVYLTRAKQLIQQMLTSDKQKKNEAGI
ncbi:MAG: sigma-70 family RNA polymerase sigma factor [Bacteroidales bacterium]|nr:sigma-70 family RNA polymerase sigma factor [Bacteroidales bacterium]